jgi:hypothetical protein
MTKTEFNCMPNAWRNDCFRWFVSNGIGWYAFLTMVGRD